jgi:hypothetical protein
VVALDANAAEPVALEDFSESLVGEGLSFDMLRRERQGDTLGGD